MGTKTVSTLAILIICILLFPFAIAIFGGLFGLIGGLFGAVFGIFGAIFGAFFGVIGWLIKIPFTIFHGTFHHANFIAICLIILLVVLITGKKSK